MEINENTYSRNIIPTESHKRNGVKHFLDESLYIDEKIWSSEETPRPLYYQITLDTYIASDNHLYICT